MKIGANKVVSITYDLYENDRNSEKIESVNETKPFVFLFGTGYMLPKFEEHLEGMGAEETFEFTLNSDDAYGEYSEEGIIDLPKNLFTENNEVPEEDFLFEGNIIPMEDEEGNELVGIIKAVSDEHISMDFNHPMAGKNLHFIGKILDIREATEEELEHGHAHGDDDDHDHDHGEGHCCCCGHDE